MAEVSPIRRLADNWDAKHKGNGVHQVLNAGKGNYCETCDLIKQLQEALKKQGE